MTEQDDLCSEEITFDNIITQDNKVSGGRRNLTHERAHAHTHSHARTHARVHMQIQRKNKTQLRIGKKKKKLFLNT